MIYKNPPHTLTPWQKLLVGRIRALTAPNGCITHKQCSIRDMVPYNTHASINYGQRRKINHFLRDLCRYQLLERHREDYGQFYYHFTEKGIHWCNRVVNVDNYFTVGEIQKRLNELALVLNDPILRKACLYIV